MVKTTKTDKAIMAIIAVVGMIVLIAYFSAANAETESFIKIEYYRNGALIRTDPLLSVVNGIEGVTDIKVKANIKNTGQVPLSCKALDALPSQLKSAMPTGSYDILVGESVEIPSGLIPVAQFDGTSPTFWVKAQCTYTYAGSLKNLTKEGSRVVTVSPDPVANFELTIGDSTGTTGGGAEPDPEPEPDEPTCLTTGTSCSVSSECCSGTCTGTLIIDSLYANCYSSGATPITCTFTGSCGNPTGCDIQYAIANPQTGGSINYGTWYYDGRTVPSGSFSITVYQDYGGYAYGNGWRAVHTTGQCA